MASLERHVVELTARDNLSATFKKVGQAAEDAGRTGQRAAVDWGKALTVTGAALGTTVGAMSRLGQAHRSEEGQIRALERAYGSSADQIIDFTDALQDMGIASDDSARIAALGAQSLAKNYGLTADQITALIERSADLAAVTFDQYGNQLELTDVTQRLAAAIRGEAESAEVLGLAMGDNALAARAAAEGMTGWTTTMTEAEKAQFRFKVAMDDSASAQGAAAERTEGLAGWLRTMRLEVGDSAAAFGGMLGPLGESTAVMGDLALAMPLVGAGAGKAVAALRGLSVAGAAANLALGPVGMVAAVAGLVGGLILLSDQQESTALSTQELGDVIEGTTASIYKQIDAYARLDLASQAEDAAALFDAFVTTGTQAEDVRFSLEELTVAVGLLGKEIEGPVGGLSEFDARWIDSAFGNGDGKLQVQEVEKALEAFTEDIGLSGDEVTAFKEDWDELMSRVLNPNFSGATILAEVDQIMRDSIMTADEKAAAIDNLVSSNFGYIESEKAVAGAINMVRPPLQDVQTEFWNLNAAAGAYYDTTAGDLLPTLDDQIDALQGSTVAADGMVAGMQNLKAEAAAVDASLADLAETLEFDAAGAAERAHSMVVGFTEGMVNSIGTSKEWIDAFAGAPGVWGTIDDLLVQGKIDLEDYNEVLDSQTRLTNANARAIDAQNIIWAKQSDVVADGADATADYLVELSKLDEANQTIALGWADMGLADQTTQIADMAAGWGDMSKAQKEAFEETVTSAAALDPVLAAMLEDLGLIKQSASDPSGWEISMDSSDAESDLDRVTTAINDLIETLETIYTLDIEPNDETISARSEIDAWTGSDHHTFITMNPDSSPFDTWVANHNGADVGDVYVDVIARQHGIGFEPFALGGMVGAPDYETAALGRMTAGALTLVGEAGPELVHLPIGSSVTPNHASRYMTGRGGGDIHIHGDVILPNVQNPQDFMRQMQRYVTHVEARR